jgi:hypothetical protein
MPKGELESVVGKCKRLLAPEVNKYRDLVFVV